MVVHLYRKLRQSGQIKFLNPVIILPAWSSSSSLSSELLLHVPLTREFATGYVVFKRSRATPCSTLSWRSLAIASSETSSCCLLLTHGASSFFTKEAGTWGLRLQHMSRFSQPSDF